MEKHRFYPIETGYFNKKSPGYKGHCSSSKRCRSKKKPAKAIWMKLGEAARMRAYCKSCYDWQRLSKWDRQKSREAARGKVRGKHGGARKGSGPKK